MPPRDIFVALLTILARLTSILVRSFDQDIGSIITRLERHARLADQTAIATELVRASEFRKAEEQRQDDETEIEYEKWLKPSNVKQVHTHHIKARLDGTCDWISTNDAFKRWIEPGSSTAITRLLAISGSHGCGKSILTSSIVVRLVEQQQCTLYFSFSSLDGNRQTVENLLRTMLWQLVHETTNKAIVDIVQKLRKQGQLTISDLWETIKHTALSLAQPVFCVIDGIDECNDFKDIMLPKLMSTRGMGTNLRILLLGRPHSIQLYGGNTIYEVIDMTSALSNDDIKAVITHEIANSDVLRLPGFRESASETLRKKSDGMFLWLRLMVDDLNKSSSKAELKERLENLPRGLEDAYRLIFVRLSQKLDKFELRLAQSLLAFTIVSCRPLSFDEFRYAHALHCRLLECDRRPLEEYLLLQPPQNVLEVVGGLISMTDGLLHLIHSSIREFLVRDEDKWAGPDLAVLDFRVDITQTHRSFAWLCLEYLRLGKEEKNGAGLATAQSVQSLRTSHPFLTYATMYTFHHLNRSGPICSITVARIETILGSMQSMLWFRNLTYLVFEDLTLHSQINEFGDLEARLAPAGLKTKLSSIFKNSLEGMIAQMRTSLSSEDPRTDQLNFLLSVVNDKRYRNCGEEQNTASADENHEPGSVAARIRTRSPTSRPRLSDLSLAVSRITDFLKGQTSVSIAHQVEMFLRLQLTLQKTRVLIDPLKVLFNLILTKASGMPVYVLMAVGHFYWKLNKPEEALEVYDAAVKKIHHLDVPLKFELYMHIGDCLEELERHREALKSYEEAHAGREILLGRSHSSTIHSLHAMIDLNDTMDQHVETIRLCDQMFLGVGNVSQINPGREQDAAIVLDVLRWRCRAYRYTMDDVEHEVMLSVLRVKLEAYQKRFDKQSGTSPSVMLNIGLAKHELGSFDEALEFCERAFIASKKSKNSTIDMMNSLECMASSYCALGKYQRARETHQLLHEAERKTYGPDHWRTRMTQGYLDDLPLIDDDGSKSDSNDDKSYFDDNLHSDDSSYFDNGPHNTSGSETSSLSNRQTASPPSGLRSDYTINECHHAASIQRRHSSSF